MRLRVFNEEVLYAEGDAVALTREDISRLEDVASRNKRQRARICTHRDVEDTLHEMFIVHTRGSYVRPHKHIAKSESLFIIKGSADLLLFNDGGDITDCIPMGESSTGLAFYNRISEPFYHTLLITSDVLVFHEVTNGPFDRSDTIFAPWAPDDVDVAAVQSYLDQLSRLALSRKTS